MEANEFKLTRETFDFIIKLRWLYGPYHFQGLTDKRMAEILWSREYNQTERRLFNSIREDYINSKGDIELPF
jgi:hypothetical protein